MTLLWILLGVFAGVALMVKLGERSGRSMPPEKVQQLSRWIMPLVMIMLVLALLKQIL